MATWERVERRSRKKFQNFNYTEKKNVYDELGRMREHENLDVCDCMDDDCPGCWGPCPKCKFSEKCGPVCRKNRNFYFESILADGKTEIIENKYFKNGTS